MPRGANCGLPSQVAEVHEQMQDKLGSRPSFEQGSLPSSALFYFAVENLVLFYDIGRAARTGCSLESCYLHQYEFPERIFELK